MEFKSSLKKFRIDNKLTQDDLGKKLGLSGKVISKWESGYSMPDIDNIKKLCEIFDCEYKDLIGPEKKNMKKKNTDPKEEVSKIENTRLNIYNPTLQSIKKISKVLYVFTKIYRVILIILLSFIVLCMFFVPSLISSVTVGNNSISFRDFKGDEVSLTGEDILLKGDYILKYKDKIIDNHVNFDIIKEVADVFENIPRANITIQIEIILSLIVISILVAILAFHNLEVLFKNIEDNDLVFTSDNVSRLAMATCLLIGVYVCDIGIYLLFDSIISVDLINNVGINRIVRIIFMILMTYIFKYGYELQKRKVNSFEV